MYNRIYARSCKQIVKRFFIAKVGIKCFEAAVCNDFLCGERTEKSWNYGQEDKHWKADFDWLINKNNLLKVIEGRYDQRKKLKEGDDGYYDNDRTW